MSVRNFITPQKKKPFCSAVILAAGSGSRFGGDKIFAPLQGVPVLAYSLSTFEACPLISEIIVVTAETKIIQVSELCDKYNITKAMKVLCGGETRLESALSGVSETDPKTKLIAIHDGARPLVTRKIITEAIRKAELNMAAVPAVPARDTVKLASGFQVTQTPERDAVFNIQTPQVFVPELIKGALTNALQKELTIYDDAQALEILGVPIFLSSGSEENIKITTPLDLMLAETILNHRRERLVSAGKDR
ncbi:MAG: 2-C-methyl-D-erythritol 4-phosphate cytidylyltransferase [Clostridiales bacterium]|nr:2-C-methyl-D-erythritol 4-phosphate cytidylyltransferase [Clostridiales bacterium]